MARKETILVEVLDDMALAEDREEPADGQVTLTFMGTTVTLDLAEARIKELTEYLHPWLLAGQRSKQTRRPFDRNGSSYRAAIIRNRDIRAWANSQAKWRGSRWAPSWGYFPVVLLREYDAAHSGQAPVAQAVISARKIQAKR